MKIAFVFPPIWPAQGDGSLQIWNREITTCLAKANDVVVFCGQFPSEHRELVGGVRYRAISTRLDNRLQKRYEYIRRFLRIERPLFATDYWYTFYALRSALSLRKERCDVVHIYNYPQFARIIRRLNPRVRLVLNMHGEWLAQIPFTNLRSRLRKVHAIVSCSDLVTRSTAAKFPDLTDRCKTIPMGITPKLFQKASSKPNRKKILYVGRISPEKGVHDLLDAFALIHKKFPDSTLTIVGSEGVSPREYIVDLCLDPPLIAKLAPFYDGGYLSKLRSRLTGAASRSVEFVGSVSHGEISKYYADADVYVSPSLYESFGMSIIEAMAAHLPVVAARGGAVPDLISDGRTGLLVDVADPAGISRAVCAFFADGALRDSVTAAAAEMVTNQFAWETISSSLAEIYQETKTVHSRGCEPKLPIEEDSSPQMSTGKLR